jgi:hypothetical protein
MCDQYVQRTRGRRLRDGAGCGTHRQRDGQDVQLGRGRGTTDDARFGGEQGLAKYEKKKVPVMQSLLLTAKDPRSGRSLHVEKDSLTILSTPGNPIGTL